MAHQSLPGAHVITLNDYPSQHHGKRESFLGHRDWAVWSWLNFIFNPIAFWCSISAIFFSYLTEVYNRAGDSPAAHRKSRCALGCNITALIIFLLYVAAIIVLYTAFTSYVMQWKNAYTNQING